jgi:hypothetical protein
MTSHKCSKKTMDKIAIYIPDEDAKKFLVFQEHYDVFDVLVKSGVFNQKNAAVTLHFDHLGILRLVQRADTLYARKRGE